MISEMTEEELVGFKRAEEEERNRRDIEYRNQNLKEWIAPSRYIGPKQVDEENRGNWKCGSCGKSVRGEKMQFRNIQL